MNKQNHVNQQKVLFGRSHCDVASCLQGQGDFVTTELYEPTCNGLSYIRSREGTIGTVLSPIAKVNCLGFRK